jgi:hypothetical protein
MRALTSKLKPASGFSYYFHLGLTSLLPVLVYVLVRIDFVQLALVIILLSKWRMLAVRPRYWAANLRYNAVDIMVGVSVLAFMTHTDSNMWQIIWATAYWVWLIFIKRGSSVFMVSLQALLGQTLALTAVFLSWIDAPLVGLVVAVWAITYLSARHFFGSFDERFSVLYSHLWGYFSAALVWVLGHWLLFYGTVSQPTLLITVLGFGLAAMYYLGERDKLSNLLRRQFVFIMIAIIVVVLVFSDWGDKAI